ncbi:HNH endonuclease [Klebsiella pneumoniae]|uniref:HNH endonuclease n=1 Tax=Klebsiella pneumoniae TaxID=573 RepID=UPI0013D449A3|nr:HNH endonuclease [Klebsiella pneumoniae]
MKMEAEITQDELKALVRYDPDTGCFYHLVARKNVSVGDVAGGLDMEGYVRLRLNGRRYKAHRLAIFYMTGKWPKAVDHKNKNRSDNRWCNIRPCSLAENNQNPGVSPKNKSGCAGVHWHGRQKKWIAAIQIDRKKLHLGSFSSKEDAEAVAVAAFRVREKMLDTMLSGGKP